MACGGSGGVFAVYDGFRKGAKVDAQDARVSVWLLDKRALSETYSKDDVEELLALVRKDASQWLKLRHPNVLRVHAPLEENRNALALVTEPVLASLADVLDNGAALREKRRSKRRRDRSAAASSSSEPPPGDGETHPPISPTSVSPNSRSSTVSSSSPTRSRSSTPAPGSCTAR